ncbi:MAG: hypothetical protein MUC58_00400 [Rhizobiaceae bacterium]|jgi:cytochrome c|nr:hypothetical protein [Rhizobiaceae bacterium]
MMVRFACVPAAVLAVSMIPAGLAHADVMSGVVLKAVVIPASVADPAAHERSRVDAVIAAHGLSGRVAHRFEAAPAFATPLDAATATSLGRDPRVAAVLPLGAIAVKPLASAPARGILIHAGPGSAAPCFAAQAGDGGVDPKACNPAIRFGNGQGVISVKPAGEAGLDSLALLKAIDFVAARGAEGSADAPYSTQIAIAAGFQPCGNALSRAIAQTATVAGLALVLPQGTATACLAEARRAAATISVVQAALPAVEGFRGGTFRPGSLAVTVRASAGTQRFTITGAPAWLPFSPAARTATAAGARFVQPVAQAAARARPVGWHKSVLRFQNGAVAANRVNRTVVLDVFGSVSAGRTRYNSLCLACHQLTENRTGPRMSGVYGRRAGSSAATGYTAYSSALAAFARPWTNELLTRYLTDPQALVPGTRMPSYSFLSVTDRQNIVAYLRAISANPPQ